MAACRSRRWAGCSGGWSRAGSGRRADPRPPPPCSTGDVRQTRCRPSTVWLHNTARHVLIDGELIDVDVSVAPSSWSRLRPRHRQCLWASVRPAESNWWAGMYPARAGGLLRADQTPSSAAPVATEATPRAWCSRRSPRRRYLLSPGGWYRQAGRSGPKAASARSCQTPGTSQAAASGRRSTAVAGRVVAVGGRWDSPRRLPPAAVLGPTANGVEGRSSGVALRT